MKDLYTFDASAEAALATYSQVRAVYSELFDTLKLPYLVAEASSGDIGGDLSHEYHLPTSVGEDHVISCNECDYVANEEMAVPAIETLSEIIEQSADMLLFRGITKDRRQLVQVWYPANVRDRHTGQIRTVTDEDINMHIIKSVVPLDSGVRLQDRSLAVPADRAQSTCEMVHVVDRRVTAAYSDVVMRRALERATTPAIEADMSIVACHELDVLQIRTGDTCPKCSAPSLKVQKAIELGHTFHLGTKYSEALSAQVQFPQQADRAGPSGRAFVQMGCHGIGVSRIIGAVADHLHDDRGLNWPRRIAPFEVVVVPFKQHADDATAVAGRLAESIDDVGTALDVSLDDRPLSLPWRLKDADTIGYPVVVVMGRTWEEKRMCSVQCRRLSSVCDVPEEELAMHVRQLLDQL